MATKQKGPTTDQTATAVSYIEYQAQMRAAAEAAALAAVMLRIRLFTEWYNTQAITALCTDIVTVVEAAQSQVAASTDLYLTQMVNLAKGVIQSPAGSVNVAKLRTGVTHAGVYGRLADNYRWLISQGKDESEAMAQVEQRATAMVNMDMALADTRQSQKTLTKARIQKYRRVLHPELAKDGKGSCGLCVVASDRIYNTDQIMPLHNGCHCQVVPISVDWDIGNSLNTQDLQSLYDQVGSNKYNDLIKTRYSVHEHGELGPTLGYSGDHWRDRKTALADEDHYDQAA